MRRFLDGLYAASAWLAGISMVGVLLMVLLTILSRAFGFSAPGTDAYAGYAMAGAGFMALASTLKAGEHIRVTLFLGMLKGKALKSLEVTALLIATMLAGFLAFMPAAWCGNPGRLMTSPSALMPPLCGFPRCSWP